MSFRRINPLRLIILGAIKLYQHTLGRILPNSCRFYPTCSTYAYDAVMRFGVMRGGWMAVKRISRCHPFNAGGFDPVPMPKKEGTNG